MDKENLKLVYLDKAYQDYIKPFCSEHQLLDKGENQRRPFLGTVLTGLNGYDYFVPLTSSDRMANSKQIDVFPLNKGKNGTLNLNLMIPVPKGEVQLFDINKMQRCKMRDMFTAQQRHIARQSGNIKKNAAEVYLRSIYAPNNNLAKRCNDFLLLEEKCKDWDKHKEKLRRKEAAKENQDMSSADQYKKTAIYTQAVEKYGQKTADKMVATLLKKALTQEKKEVKEEPKTEKKQAVSSTKETSKNTAKKTSTTAKKSSDKGTVTTVTIKSSPAKGK